MKFFVLKISAVSVEEDLARVALTFSTFSQDESGNATMATCTKMDLTSPSKCHIVWTKIDRGD
jgi:hypothetical protein